MGCHGVFDFEKTTPQRFVVDVVVDVANDAASRSDELDKTVNYAEIAEIVQKTIEDRSYSLLERLAAEVADRVTRLQNVHSVEVTVHKPDAPMTVDVDDVAVTVRRCTSAPSGK